MERRRSGGGGEAEVDGEWSYYIVCKRDGNGGETAFVGGRDNSSGNDTAPTTASHGAITRPLRLRMRLPDGQWTPIVAPASCAVSPAIVDDPLSPRRLTRSKGGELEVMDRGPVATAYTVTDETLTVDREGRRVLRGRAPTSTRATTWPQPNGVWDLGSRRRPPSSPSSPRPPSAT